METLIVGLRATVFTLVVTGVIYPLAITGLAQLIFPARANGSLVSDDQGEPVGSELIAQGFSRPEYFQPRPSAAGDKGYDPLASGGSNFSPTSQKLHDRFKGDLERLYKDNPKANGPVPAELIMASGSGLDPHISPKAAEWQIPRIAQARSIDPERIRQVMRSAVEDRDLGFLGEPRVNVLLLNLALDRHFGRPAPPAALPR